MKSIFPCIVLILIIGLSLGCDEDNNVIAQEPGPMEPGDSMPEAMTMVTGKIIDPGDQCDGMLGGFAIGDEISIEMNGGSGEDLPSGKVENTTAGTSVDCGGSTSIQDTPLLSLLSCASQNSQISSFTNGNFMTMLVDFSWLQSFKQDITKSAYVIATNIDFVKDQDIKNVPCARVMIETISASN